MSLGLSYSRPERPATSLPILRWVGLVALLLVEVLAVTIRFDTGTLDDEKGLWAVLIGEAHHLPHVAIAIAAALVVFGGGRVRSELQQSVESLSRPRTLWPYLAAHAAVYGAFFLVSAQLLEGSVGSPAERGAWAVAWFLLGLTSVALLGSVALPFELWLRLARRLAVPLALSAVLGLSAWGAGQFTDQLWVLLADSTFWIVRNLLGLFTADIVCDPERCNIGTTTFWVNISPECSGYEGMGLIWVFLGGYLWLFRGSLRFPQAWLLLPAGTVIIYLANSVRIAALVAVGTWISPDVAMGGFHSQAGWLAFNGVALGLVLLTRQSRFFTADTEARPVRSPVAAYLAPLLVLVGSVMVTAALSNGFDWFYPARVVAVGAVLCCYRREYARLAWGCSWQAVAVGVGVFALWLALEPLAGVAAETAGLPTGVARGWLGAWLVFRVLGSVVTVPLAEELAFRGYLLRRLQGRDFQEVPAGRFSWLSFVVSSVLFGVLHGRWLAGTLAGMAYAGILYRRGRLADPVVAHGVTNLLIAVYVLTTGSWSLWS